MENKTNGIIFNPNLIWLPTPLQMENSEDFAHIDAFLPGSTGERIEDGRQSVLQQFRDLLLTQNLI